jgi:hypothetical protein
VRELVVVVPVVWDQLRNAFLADCTAQSTSSAWASATSQIFSPVAGLVVAKVLRDLASTHLLSISNLVCSWGSLTLDGISIFGSYSLIGCSCSCCCFCSLVAITCVVS